MNRLIRFLCWLVFWPLIGNAQNLKHDLNIWLPANGAAPDRMLLATNWSGFKVKSADLAGGPELYRTVWKRTDTNLLVCFQYPGLELFGTPYQVALVDPSHRIVRRGSTTAWQNDTPYCIAELRSRSERLPPELRGQWLLAVGFWDNRFQEWCRWSDPEAGEPKLSREEIKKKIAKLPKKFYFELIHWDDAKVNPKYGSGNLYGIRDLEYRWIEPGTNLLKVATNSVASRHVFFFPSGNTGR